MSKLLIILSFILFCQVTNGQTCYHSDLSNDFDFETSLQRFKMGEFPDSCLINIRIINKVQKKEVQLIQISSTFLFDNAFRDCYCVRSYVTGKNKKNDSSDNDFGDLIIADFNFDSIADMAVKNNSGGNGGPTYDFYLQTKNGEFTRDSYLTESMEFFPSELNSNKMTLVTLVNTNVSELCEITYKYRRKSSNWTKVKRRFISY